MADKKPPPKFKVGDKVTSFRGEKATVDRVRNVEHPGKSHRVGVTWEGKRGSDAVDYYETVFDRTKAPAKKAAAKKAAAKKAAPAKAAPRKKKV